MLIKLLLWKWFRQWIYSIQIRVHFANFDFIILYMLTYDMVTPGYMFGDGVVPWILCICNGTRVVTKDVHRVTHAREHTEFRNELPQPNSLIGCFSSSHILRLHCRLSYRRLLPAPPAHGATVHHKYISRLRHVVIWI